MGNQTSGGAGTGGGNSFLAKDTKDKRKAMRSALDADLIPKNAYERILDALPAERIKSAWLGGDHMIRIGEHAINIRNIPGKALMGNGLSHSEQILARRMLKNPFMKTIKW